MKDWDDDWHLRKIFEQKVVTLTRLIEDAVESHELERSESIQMCWEAESILSAMMSEVYDTVVDIALDKAEELRNKSEQEVVEILLEKPYLLKYIHTPTQNMLNAVDMAKL